MCMVEQAETRRSYLSNLGRMSQTLDAFAVAGEFAGAYRRKYLCELFFIFAAAFTIRANGARARPPPEAADLS